VNRRRDGEETRLTMLIASADVCLDSSEKRRKAEVVWDKHDGIIGRIIYQSLDSEGTPRRFGPANAANVAKAMRWLAREVVKAHEARWGRRCWDA
jgi:hypothetical protein